MMYIYIGVTFLLSVLLAIVIIPRIIFISYKKRLFDEPDARKVHTTPIPRLGGLAFLPIIVISLCVVTGIRYYTNNPVDSLWSSSLFIQYLFFIVGLTMLYLIGVADITNAINLIDGVDGLASGLYCIALGLLIIVCVLVNQWTHALLAAATLGVVMVFYYYYVFSLSGWKLFMGDAGSLTLGYVLSFLILHFWQKNILWDPFIMNLNMVTLSTLFIPLFDVIRVFYSHVRERRNPFIPDKNHIHHRLLLTGMSVRMVMFTLLLISLFFVTINFVLSLYINTTLMLLLDFFFGIIMHLIIRYYIAKHETLTGKKWYKVYQSFYSK